jgi:hypothetical protein
MTAINLSESYPKYHIAIGLTYDNKDGQAVTDAVLNSIQSGSILIQFEIESKSIRQDDLKIYRQFVVSSTLIVVFLEYPTDKGSALKASVKDNLKYTQSHSISQKMVKLDKLEYVFESSLDVPSSRDVNSALSTGSSFGHYSGLNSLNNPTGQTGLTVILAADVTTTFQKLLLLLKIVDLMKHLNLNFKPVLTAFFDGTGKMFTPNGKTWTKEDISHDTGVRGKFEVYMLGIINLITSQFKVYLYMGSFVLVYLVRFIKDAWMDTHKIISTLIRFHRRFHSMMFLANSLEFLFHGFHIYAHTSTYRIDSLLSNAATSYCLSVALLAAVAVEYWSLCSCILDDSVWRKYIKYEISVKNKEDALLKVMKVSQSVNSSSANLKSRAVFLRGTAVNEGIASNPGKRGIPTMPVLVKVAGNITPVHISPGEDITLASHSFLIMAQMPNILSSQLDKDTISLKFKYIRFLAILEVWRSPVIGTALVAGQYCPIFAFAVIAAFELCRAGVTVRNYIKMKHFATPLHLVADLNQSVMVIFTISIFMALHQLDGNQDTLSILTVYLIVGSCAIQYLCSIVIVITVMMRSGIRFMRLRKARKFLEFHSIKNVQQPSIKIGSPGISQFTTNSNRPELAKSDMPIRLSRFSPVKTNGFRFMGLQIEKRIVSHKSNRSQVMKLKRDTQRRSIDISSNHKISSSSHRTSLGVQIYPAGKEAVINK